MTNIEWIHCPKCGARIRKEQLPRHADKAHSKENQAYDPYLPLPGSRHDEYTFSARAHRFSARAHRFKKLADEEDKGASEFLRALQKTEGNISENIEGIIDGFIHHFREHDGPNFEDKEIKKFVQEFVKRMMKPMIEKAGFLGVDLEGPSAIPFWNLVDKLTFFVERIAFAERMKERAPKFESEIVFGEEPGPPEFPPPPPEVV